MKRLKMRNAAMMLLCLLALVATSCSNDSNQLLSTIPSSSMMVMNINGEKLCKAMDCKVVDGKLQIPDDLRQAMQTDPNELNESLEIMGKFASTIDYKNIFCVLASDSFDYFTFAVKDVDKLKTLVTTELHMEEAANKGSFDVVYTKDFDTLILRDEQGWYITRRREKAVEALTEQLNSATNGNFASIPTVTEALSDDDEIMTLVLSQKGAQTMSPLPMPAASPEWIVATGDVEDNAILLEFKTIDANGKEYKAKGFEKLDLDFLRYVPGDWNFAAAIALDENFDWDSVFSAISEFTKGDYQTAMVVEILKPYLRSIDGTAAVAGHIPSQEDIEAASEGNFSAIQALMMVHMDQQKVNDAVNQLTALFKQMHIPYQERSNGIYSLTVGRGITVDFGSVNGSFAIATIPLKPNAQNSLTKVFQGQVAGAYLSLPSLAPYVAEIPWGIDYRLSCGESEGKLTIRLQGTDAPILPAIVKALSQI